MMRTTPRRRTTLHLSHIRLTEALTFIAVPASPSHVPALKGPSAGVTARPARRAFTP
jgi:hypothetical protein